VLFRGETVSHCYVSMDLRPRRGRPAKAMRKRPRRVTDTAELSVHDIALPSSTVFRETYKLSPIPPRNERCVREKGGANRSSAAVSVEDLRLSVLRGLGSPRAARPCCRAGPRAPVAWQGIASPSGASSSECMLSARRRGPTNNARELEAGGSPRSWPFAYVSPGSRPLRYCWRARRAP